MTSSDPEFIPGRSPAFQFYPNDFISDRNVVLMSMAERGVYITLLCYAWQEPLPNDTDRLSRLCGMPLPVFRKLWPAVRICFLEQGEHLIQPRLERERQKQADYRRRQSDRGRASGEARRRNAGSTGSEPAYEPGANAGSTGVQTASFNSSSSSSSSSSDFRQKAAVVRTDARSKRPIFTGQRLTVFDWMLDDLYRLLGKPVADALDVHEFFFALDARMAETSQVVPQRDGGKWLQQQALDEAQKRGLISAPEHKSKLTLALEAASSGW
jgi:uncharacterized protein YdaU (DUF1376 family)